MWKDDNLKKRRILRHVNLPQLSWLDATCKNKTYKQVCTLIKEYALKREYLAIEQAGTVEPSICPKLASRSRSW